MEIEKIELIHQGKYISYYEASYKLDSGHIKKYELVSRNHSLTTKTLGRGRIEGVGLVPFSENHEKIILQKEYRLSCNDWVYTFPAGIIDLGEEVSVAAKRELKEETGVDLIKVIDILPACFTCQGFSDELMEIVICEAKGDVRNSLDEAEVIEANWYSKEDVRKLFDLKVKMSVRTQMFLWCWLNQKERQN